MRPAFTSLAEQDLEAIADYIAVDDPVRALGFMRELRAGHYVIVFEADPDAVLIVRILHGARDIT